MNHSSEYQFPIFISSTDYNLIDLRAELSHFLTDIGYRPILSSSGGFHDKSPNLEPWESCIPVLDSCFVMILIIDGRYGSALSWPNYKSLPTINSPNRKYVSPTHGEYLYAHKNKKRMLVFVRQEVLIHYQSYRAAIKLSKNKQDAKKALKLTLPRNIDFESLDFLNEVKTSKPIPWIKEFDDVTSVKKEVHRKMLNELAEIFMLKSKHFETVIQVFNKAMDELSPEKQSEILEKINATKGITAIKNELSTKKIELQEINERKSQKDSKKDSKIKELQNKIKKLEADVSNKKYQYSDLLIRSDGKLRINTSNYLFDSGSNNEQSNLYLEPFAGLFSTTSKRCDKCGKQISNDSPLNLENLNKCSYCRLEYCNDCWSQNVGDRSLINKCPACQEK